MSENTTAIPEETVRTIRTLLLQLIQMAQQSQQGFRSLGAQSFGGSPAGGRVTVERTGAIRTQTEAAQANLADLAGILDGFDSTLAEFGWSEENINLAMTRATDEIINVVNRTTPGSGPGRVMAV